MLIQSMTLLASVATATMKEPNQQTAASTTRRIAVVIGANGAAPNRKPLRYAHLDAQSVAAVLEELGAFAPQDIHVLFDPQPQEALRVLDEQLTQLDTEEGETLLLFYYSGHADAQALYPDGKPLTLHRLRSRLDSTRAQVRLSVVDACRGGGWTGTKGLNETDNFEVALPLDLANEGSALISSSSGLEDAHESEQLKGSFFTHHWVAALRGAGDHNEDGTVTLSEAFEYAKALTIRDTALHAETPQHPSFQINLRGRQDLPVANTGGGESHLALQQKKGPLQVVHLSTGIVLMEAPGGKRSLRLAVPPGTYLVRRRAGDTTWAREVKVEPGKTAHVAEEDLELVAGELLVSKGATPIVEIGPEEPTALARAELAIYQTAHGIALGAETCILAECDDTRVWVLSMIAGGGLGLGVSLGLTGDGIKPGHTLLLNSSVGWGFWNGLAIANIAEPDDGKHVAGLFMASQLTGLGLGLLLKNPWDPGAGDVALTNTVGIWSGVLALLVHGANEFDASGDAIWGTLLAAADVGLFSGAVLSRRFPMSRGRTLIIDAGGILGMLSGMGVMLLIQGDNLDATPFFASAIVGTVAGLGTATYLTRNWDVPDVSGELAVVPIEGGAMALYGARF